MRDGETIDRVTGASVRVMEDPRAPWGMLETGGLWQASLKISVEDSALLNLHSKTFCGQSRLTNILRTAMCCDTCFAPCPCLPSTRPALAILPDGCDMHLTLPFACVSSAYACQPCYRLI